MNNTSHTSKNFKLNPKEHLNYVYLTERLQGVQAKLELSLIVMSILPNPVLSQEIRIYTRTLQKGHISGTL